MLGFHGAPMVEDQSSSLAHNDVAVGKNMLMLVPKKSGF